MASSSATEGTCLKEFPGHLAQGVLQDLLAKELDALLSPEDEGKTAALEAAEASLPRRLELIRSQIAASSPNVLLDGVCNLVAKLWLFVAQRPDLASIKPSTGEASVFLGALTDVIAAACAVSASRKPLLMDGCFLVSAALIGIAAGGLPPTAPELAVLATLLDGWSEVVVSEGWGVTDPWGVRALAEGRNSLVMSPLELIARHGLVAFVPLALAKGCPADGNFARCSAEAPAALALYKGHFDVFEALLAHGLDLLRPYEEDGWPLAICVFYSLWGPKSVYSDLLRRHPEIVHATTSKKATDRLNLLDAAIISGDADLVDWVLSAGAPLEYCAHFDGTSKVPSLARALFQGNRRILELLITKGKALEGWKDKYDEEALDCIVDSLISVAISAYPSNPHFKGDPELLVKYNPEANECLELVLSSGIVCNPIMVLCCYCYVEGRLWSCVLEEKHMLAVLKRFHAAGFDIVSCLVAGGDRRPPVMLQDAVTGAGHNEVLVWFLEELGWRPLQPAQTSSCVSLLSNALRSGNIEGAMLLLEKYKVDAAYPGLDMVVQPVCSLMANIARMESYSDAEAHRILTALIERNPDLFDLPCFSETTIAQKMAAFVSRLPRD